MENYIGTKQPLWQIGVFRKKSKVLLTGWSTSQSDMLNNNWIILTTNE